MKESYGVNRGHHGLMIKGGQAQVENKPEKIRQGQITSEWRLFCIDLQNSLDFTAKYCRIVAWKGNRNSRSLMT